jgi:hypothetical protein
MLDPAIKTTRFCLSISRMRVVARDRIRADPSAQLRASPGHSADLRVKSNFLNRIKLLQPVQSFPKKYSDFPNPQITL